MSIIEKLGSALLNSEGLGEERDAFKVVAHFIKKGDLESIKHILDLGYDINSSESGDFGSSLLHNAIRYNQMELFEYLIEQGADIDFADAVGWTPLMESIIDSRPEFGAILVAKGADQNLQNVRGANAKMLAMKFGQHSFLEFLD